MTASFISQGRQVCWDHCVNESEVITSPSLYPANCCSRIQSLLGAGTLFGPAICMVAPVVIGRTDPSPQANCTMPGWLLLNCRHSALMPALLKPRRVYRAPAPIQDRSYSLSVEGGPFSGLLVTRWPHVSPINRVLLVPSLISVSLFFVWLPKTPAYLA